jgi:hypothetical protein
MRVSIIDPIGKRNYYTRVRYTIYLGNKKNRFNHIQDLYISGLDNILSDGKCNYIIKIKPFAELFGKSESVYFDCVENKFIINSSFKAL